MGRRKGAAGASIGAQVEYSVKVWLIEEGGGKGRRRGTVGAPMQAGWRRQSPMACVVATWELGGSPYPLGHEVGNGGSDGLAQGMVAASIGGRLSRCRLGRVRGRQRQRPSSADRGGKKMTGFHGRHPLPLDLSWTALPVRGTMGAA
jgi:hypothetical protein